MLLLWNSFDQSEKCWKDKGLIYVILKQSIIKDFNPYFAELSCFARQHTKQVVFLQQRRGQGLASVNFPISFLFLICSKRSEVFFIKSVSLSVHWLQRVKKPLSFAHCSVSPTSFLIYLTVWELFGTSK